MTNDMPAERFGPAMKACTERQRQFVWALLDGCRSNKEAASRAGYQGDANTLAVTGHRLAHDPNVQAAIQEEAKRRLNSTAILAVNKLALLVESNDQKVQLKAIEMVLNRAGLHATSEHKVQVEHFDGDAAGIRQIYDDAKKLGLDPVLLLGKMGIKMLPPPTEGEDAIEGEFVEVEKEEWE